MAQRVGIVAVAQTKYEGSKPGLRMAELAHQPVKEVLQQTGLKFTEDGSGIDFSICATDDFWDAMTLSDTPIGDVIGAHHRSAEKVSQDGAQAAIYATIAILSGHYDTVLLVAHCKESQPSSRNLITNCAFCPVCTRALGVDYLSAAALQAKRYMYKYGITREQCAKVSVKSYKNAKNNPYAQNAMDITVEDVLGSKMLAYPISVFDAYPVSDGACAMILATEEKAKKLTDKPVWVKGVGNCYDCHHLGDRDLADCDSLEMATKRAYKMAGIKNPLREIDIVEISGQYTYQELLWSEGLGFCNKGEGGKLVDSGITEMGGKLPINPSGGVLPGNPIIVAGLTRVVECVLQLKGEAGGRQVAKAKTALAHGTSGPCGQLHSVLILGT
jgi:acetyl-CoA C-acetyltransferase